MMMEEDKFMIDDKIYYKLIQFLDKSTNKRFYIYTDNNRDTNGNLKLYSSIVLNDNGVVKYLPVVDSIDIDSVKQALFQVKLNLN